MNNLPIPGGYIVIARKIRNSTLWKCLNAAHRLILIELLLQAQYADGEVVRNGEVIFLNRGQIATSYQCLVNDIGDKCVTIKVVRCAIEKLIKHDFLAKDEAKARAKRGLLLTIVNYDFYQSPDNYEGKAKGSDTGKARAKRGQSEGKARAINKESKEGEACKERSSTTPYREILEMYHSTCVSFSKVRDLTDNRKHTLNARWEDCKKDILVFQELFTLAEQSDFLSGRKPSERNPSWKADFDWLLVQQNMTKTLEGKYKNKTTVNQVNLQQTKPAPQRADLKPIVDDNDPEFLEFLRIEKEKEAARKAKG